MTAPHLPPGTVVAGRYTIHALLGFTGEAATYHAVASSGHEVVLKLYDPQVGQRADIMSKLERVNATLAQMPMELVVPVADSGYDMTTSAPFSVCERVQYPSLAQLCEQGPLAPGVVAKVVEGMARALDACHPQQLYHLALKPSNIFVGPAPQYPVRLADFGASVIRSSSPTHEAYAQSAPWWAPEQLQPAAVLGGPADVFTTALVAFYALTGRSYWHSCQQSPPDLPNWQLEIMGQRVPVSQRSAQLGVPINSAVDGVFARALSVNQPDRPRSAMELASALAGIGGGGAYRSDYAGPSSKTLAFPDDPYGQQQQQQQQQAMQVPAGASGGYPPPGQSAASGGYVAPAGQMTPQPPQMQQSPGLPPVAPVQKKQGSSTPIVIGVIAAVLIGGAAGAFLFLRPRGGAAATSASASAKRKAAKPTASASEAPPPPPPPPTTPASASGSAESEPPPPEAKLDLTLQCTPQCDELLVDNEKIEKLEEKNKLAVLPGRHTIEARKQGYITLKDTLELDKPLEKELKLVKLGDKPMPKKCGQFLKCK